MGAIAKYPVDATADAPRARPTRANAEEPSAEPGKDGSCERGGHCVITWGTSHGQGTSSTVTVARPPRAQPRAMGEAPCAAVV